jgi:hypothetical protein
MEIVVSAENKHLRFGKYRRQEVMLRQNLGSKLVCRVHDRIDIPPKSFLSFLYRRDHIAEGRVTDEGRSMSLEAWSSPRAAEGPQDR